MALTIVGFTTTSGNTGAEPAGSASGDIVYAWGFNASTGTIPTNPVSWISQDSGTYSATNAFSSARITRGGSAPSYVFTNATEVAVLVLRPLNSGGTFVFAKTAVSPSSPTFTTPALASITNPSVVVSIVLLDGADTISSSPAGYTLLNSNATSEQIHAGYQVISGTSSSSAAWSLGGHKQGWAIQAAIPVTLSTVVTSDVSSTAAASQTVTNTITSAGAASQTATRTVSSTAAATRVAARTVTSAASVTTGTLVTKTVTSSAAATATVTKAVTSTAAATTTLTKTISSSAAVSRTHTAAVTTLASANRVVTASVTSTAAVSITHTRSVTTTASAGAVATKSVTSAGAASRTLSATVGTVAAVVIQRMPVNLPGAAVVIDTRTTGAPVVIETRLPGASVVIDARTNGGSVITSRGY